MNSIFFNLVLSALLLIVFEVVPIKSELDQSLCPGPLKLYESLKCQSLFDSTSSCPYASNCDFNSTQFNNLDSSECNVHLVYDNKIKNKCAPVYDMGQSVRTLCPLDYRCQNSNDTVVKPMYPSTFEKQVECTFGTLKFKIRERLERVLFSNSNQVCMDCVCQVPPLLTCERMPKNFCANNNDIIRIDY